MRLSQKAVVSVQMHVTDPEQMPTTREDEEVRTTSKPSMLGTTEGFRQLKVERKR